ncbi:MAG TPA: hypothetical protein VF678_14960 [bacterium]
MHSAHELTWRLPVLRPRIGAALAPLFVSSMTGVPMFSETPTDRPDLLRARAVLDAMRDPAGKQVRTVKEAIVWIDKHRPGLTQAWRAWVAERRILKGNPPPLLS